MTILQINPGCQLSMTGIVLELWNLDQGSAGYNTGFKTLLSGADIFCVHGSISDHSLTLSESCSVSQMRYYHLQP